MSSADLDNILSNLHTALEHEQLDQALTLLAHGKRTLLYANALIPTVTGMPPRLLAQARAVLELGALTSIRRGDPEGFQRYYAQLQPFYDVERHLAETGRGGEVCVEASQRSKITGLYLLWLLSVGEITDFHTTLEGLVVEAASKGRHVEDDPYIRYPVELERSLMEGSYDRVWKATKSERVPTADFGLFSSVLVSTIRNEIAYCSEKAYPSLPISNAKNLFFLDSEGAVVDFSRERGWVVKDGRIYFPEQEAAATEVEQPTLAAEKNITLTSGHIIENAIGYARELETIV